MPEHFLALIKQSANLASNSEAERSATAFISSLAATLDDSIFDQIAHSLPPYLQPQHTRQFFLHRKVVAKQFNQEIFLNRMTQTLHLTDNAETKNRVSAVMYALKVVQPSISQKLASSLPTDLNKYW